METLFLKKNYFANLQKSFYIRLKKVKIPQKKNFFSKKLFKH